MQSPNVPTISEADLKLARELLFGERVEARPARRARGTEPRTDVAFHNGISRARIRNAARAAH